MTTSDITHYHDGSAYVEHLNIVLYAYDGQVVWLAWRRTTRYVQIKSDARAAAARLGARDCTVTIYREAAVVCAAGTTVRVSTHDDAGAPLSKWVHIDQIYVRRPL